MAKFTKAAGIEDLGLWVKMQAATCLHAFCYKGLGAVETFEY